MPVFIELDECLLILEIKDRRRSEDALIKETEGGTHSDFTCLAIVWALGDCSINLHLEKDASVSLIADSLSKVLGDKVTLWEPWEIGEDMRIVLRGSSGRLKNINDDLEEIFGDGETAST